MNPLDDDEDDGLDDEETTVSELVAKFDAASQLVRGSVGALKPDELLYLYARYKQALDGPCNTPRPGFFDFQGKQKWDAWHALGSLPADTARQQYVDFIDQRFPGWSTSTTTKGSGGRSALGARVSTMARSPGDSEGDDNDVNDADKTAFQWLKAGQSDRALAMVAARPALVAEADAEGQTLLHWAADRANLAACRALLDAGAEPNRPDAEGLTPLHLAVAAAAGAGCCAPVVALLLSRGADPDAAAGGGDGDDDDNDGGGLKPRDLTDDPEVLALLTAGVSGSTGAESALT